MVKNFKITASRILSEKCIAYGLLDFKSIYDYVKKLPYGRNSNRSNYTLILKEQRGTCATKHAFLKALAIENDYTDLQLCLGIYKMSGHNTVGIAKVLKKTSLNYIPEAHCYLKIKGVINDITFNNFEQPLFTTSLLHEEFINPNQIGQYKVALHQKFLKDWILQENKPLNFDTLWAVREECIAKLSL
jgi:hypothetical protein